MVEHDDVGGVHEGATQVLGHELGREELPTAHDVLGGVPVDACDELLEPLAHGIGEPQLAGDVHKALLDVAQKVGAIHVVLDVGVHKQQQVRDLVVA